jgi:hypothetical protein
VRNSKSPIDTAKYFVASQPGLSAQTLSIAVVFTGTRPTLAALKFASELAGGLGAEIRVIAPQVVSYALPLDCPAAIPGVAVETFRSAAECLGIKARIEIRLCRDRDVALAESLPASSLVVIARRYRWWAIAENSAARKLRRAGHHVLLVNQS